MNRAVAGAIATALASVALLAGGCGDDSPDPGTIADAADATVERGGMRAKGKIWGTRDDDTGFVVRTIGNENVATGLAEYRLRSAGFADVLGSGRELDGRVVKRGSVAFALERSIANTLRQLELGREWLQIEYGDAAVSGHAELAATAFLLLQSPARLLHYARAATTEERGKSTRIAGADTTLYTGSVSLDDLRRRAPEYERGVLRREVGLFRGDSDREEVPIQVWIGDDGLIRKIRVYHETKHGPEERSVELSGFGRKVKAEAPDSFQYALFSELVRHLDKGHRDE